MSEEKIIRHTSSPATVESLSQDLSALGLRAGQTVLVHSSLSSLGYVSGGAQSVISALLEVLGESGTLILPTHTTQNTEPSNWQAPPVPEAWWSIIRNTRPAYQPDITPTRGMGAISELFRTLPGVKRSAHPTVSFAATGPNADYLLGNHTSLEEELGEDSPVGKLYELDGYILLLGVSHDSNSSLHLAEYRANYANKKTIKEGTAILVDGERQWVEYEMLDLDPDDFKLIAADFSRRAENKKFVSEGKVAQAQSIYMQQSPLIDFSVDWMNMNR